MLAHIRITSNDVALSHEKQQDLYEKTKCVLSFACMFFFRLRSMLHLSARTNGWLQWPYHELFRDPNSALCVPADSLSFSLLLPRSFFPSFSLFLSIVFSGLTVNSELYMYDLHVYVRAMKQYVQSNSFRVWPHENARRPLYAMRVWATSRLGVITGQQMIVSRSPPTFLLSAFSAHRPTENTYVQSLQSLRHR